MTAVEPEGPAPASPARVVRATLLVHRRIRAEDDGDAVGLPARDLAADTVERVVGADVDREGIGREDLLGRRVRGGLCGLVECRATLVEELLRVVVAEARDEALAPGEQAQKSRDREGVPG